MSSRSKGWLPGGRSRPGAIVRVRNRMGVPLMCTWDDCERDGDDRIQIKVPKSNGEPGYTIFIFCTEGHRQMFYDRSKQRQD